MPAGFRRFASAASLLLAAALLLWAFGKAAELLTARHLAQQAGALQATLQAGRSPWQWPLRSRDDLVAGRAFGRADVTKAAGGLRFTSQDGTAFDLGWPIERGLDLAHWPILVLSRDVGPTVQMAVVWQSDGGPDCISRPIAWKGTVRRIDLRALSWQPSGEDHCSLPSNARLFRLRLTLPARASVTLRAAALQRPASAPSLVAVTAPLVIDPARWPAQKSALAVSNAAAPLVQTPQGASAEAMLAWRDEILALRPAARVMPAGAIPVSEAEKQPPSYPGWLIALSYLFCLIWLARRRPGPGPGPTLVATLIGPLWVIAGLRWGLRAPMPELVAFAAAIGFAGWTSWRERPHGWRWLGAWRAARWWLPFALVPLAIAICLACGGPWHAPPLRHALTYLGWAVLQQWLILGFVLPRLEQLLPARIWAVLGAAALFAVLHTPNGLLMQLCFAAELWWAWSFTRSRSLLPVALAHASCALIVGAGLVGHGLRSLEVSARFFL